MAIDEFDGDYSQVGVDVEVVDQPDGSSIDKSVDVNIDISDESREQVEGIKADFQKDYAENPYYLRSGYWETIRTAIDPIGFKNSAELLSKNEKLWRDKTGAESQTEIQKAFFRVAQDRHGAVGSGEIEQGPDVASFRGVVLEEEFLDKVDLDDPEQLAQLTDLVGLLISYGLYKFSRWQNTDQLEQGLRLLDAISEKNPQFDILEAGHEVASEELPKMLAALELDDEDNPNFKYAYPERKKYFQVVKKSINILDKVGARALARMLDEDDDLE